MVFNSFSCASITGMLSLGDTGNIESRIIKTTSSIEQTVRIIKSREFPCLLLESLLVNPVILDYLICQIHIQTYTMVIDVLVQVPQFLLLPHDWVYLQLFADGSSATTCLLSLNNNCHLSGACSGRFLLPIPVLDFRLTGLTSTVSGFILSYPSAYPLRKPQGFSHPPSVPGRPRVACMCCRAPSLLGGISPARRQGMVSFQSWHYMPVLITSGLYRPPRSLGNPVPGSQWIQVSQSPSRPARHYPWYPINSSPRSRAGCICIHPCLPNINAGIGFYVISLS